MANDPITLAVDLARRFEGFRSHPYLDCAGVPTVGYGFTHYADGTLVRLTDPPIPQPTADDLLRLLVARICAGVMRLCPAASAGQLAALTDFAYNLGLARLRASAAVRCARAGRWDLVPAELRKWRRAGGKVRSGLVLRREAEIALI